MAFSRRRFLELSAAASAVGALGQNLTFAELAAGQDGMMRWVKSVCRYCGTGCGVYVGVQGGKVVAVQGDKDNHNAGSLCLKGVTLPQIMNAPDRLQHPLIRRNGVFERATWDEAMALVASKFKEAIDTHGPDAVAFYGSGQGTVEETYCANKLFKAGIRTNNVEGNPRLCMASAVGGYTTTFGKDEPSGCYEDIDHADVILLIGSNAAEAHPILHRRITRRKKTHPSTKIIVMDPRATLTSRAADLHLAFVPGTDLAVLNAMAHVLFKEGLVDEAFIAKHVVFGEGAEANKSIDDYRAFLEPYTPEAVAKQAGCKAADIVTAARWFGAKGKSALSMWCMGVNQRTTGVWVNNLIHNLHLVTGKFGLPGSSSFSLTGQPNACGGVRDGGALSHLLPYGRAIANEKHRAEMEQLWGVPAGTIQPKPGLACIDMFRALEAGSLKALYVMCTNPGQSLPDVERYRKAMLKDTNFVVVTEAYHPTRTSELADVVLPAALWAEKEGVYANSERRYQLLEASVKPLGESRPDFEILCDLAARLGHGTLLPFGSPEEIWAEILKVNKGTTYDFQGMTRERLRQAHGLMWPIPSEGHTGTKRRYVKGDDPLVPADHPERIKFYGRPDNKAVAWLRPFKAPAETVDAQYPMYLNTGRALLQWHTATMTSKCKEMKTASLETLAEMHPADAKRLGLREGDTVTVASRRGSGSFRVKVTDLSREGSVYMNMHDPDRMCNVLTNDAVDPVSKQPEFKIAAVSVVKEATS